MKNYFFIVLIFFFGRCNNDCNTTYQKIMLFSEFNMLIPSELVETSNCSELDDVSKCIQYTNANGLLNLKVLHYKAIDNGERTSLGKKTTIEMLKKRNPKLTFKKRLDEENRFIIEYEIPINDRMLLGLTGVIFDGEDVITIEFEQRSKGTKSEDCLLQEYMKIFNSY